MTVAQARRECERLLMVTRTQVVRGGTFDLHRAMLILEPPIGTRPRDTERASPEVVELMTRAALEM